MYFYLLECVLVIKIQCFVDKIVYTEILDWRTQKLWTPPLQAALFIVLMSLYGVQFGREVNPHIPKTHCGWLMFELFKTGVYKSTNKKILPEFICKTYLLWIPEVGDWMLVQINSQFILKETTIVLEKQDSWQTFLCFMAWSTV